LQLRIGTLLQLIDVMLDHQGQLPPSLAAELRKFRASYLRAEPCRIDRDDPRLYVRIAAALLDDITAGVLKPGDQVPSHPSLARQHHVSILTAGKAVQLLAAHGLTELDGNAYWVRDPPERA
jgi:hypothetical protein